MNTAKETVIDINETDNGNGKAEILSLDERLERAGLLSKEVLQLDKPAMIDEGRTLRAILGDSYTFDKAFAKYVKGASKYATNNIRLTDRIFGVYDSFNGTQNLNTGKEPSGLRKLFNVMTDALGRISDCLTRLCTVYRTSQNNVKVLLKHRGRETIDAANAYDTLMDHRSEQEFLMHEIASKIKGPYTETEQIRYDVARHLLEIDINEKAACARSLHNRAEQTRDSIEMLHHAHDAQVKAAIAYTESLDNAKAMLDNIMVIGPADITAIYLANGGRLLNDRVELITNHHNNLRANVTSQLKGFDGSGAYWGSSAQTQSGSSPANSELLAYANAILGKN